MGERSEEIYKILKSDRVWYNKSYSGYPLGIHEQLCAISHESTQNNFAIPLGMYYQNYKFKDHLDWFWGVKDLKDKREMVLEKTLSNPDFAEEVLKIGEANHKKFKEYTEEIKDLDIEKIPNKQLKDVFEKLHNLLIEVSLWAYAVDCFLSDEKEDWLETLIKETLKERATQEVIETLTLPTFSSFINESELLFLKIVNEIKNDNENVVATLAEEYGKKYFWIRTNYKEYKRVTSNQILKEAREWLKQNPGKDTDKLIELEKDRINSNISKKQNLYNKLNIPSELKSVLRISEVFTHLQDNRKERVLRMNTLFYEFVEETQKRFSIPKPLGFYMTDKELFGYYEDKSVNLSKIQDRYYHGFLEIFLKDTIEIIPASVFKEEEIDKNFFKTYDDIKEISGTTAYKGLVRGKVRVLRNIKGMSNFKDEEILVINQTTPEYVPAIKKASAIVTEQGGITCHAAIISRELKKPCIIGTKIATQVLKDGDTVEVDADNGVVRVLN